MANNQYVNKVVYGNQTLIDLTSDTINPDVLVQGYTAHNRAGEIINGTLQEKAPQAGFDNGRFEIKFPYGLYSGTMHLETIRIPVPSAGTNAITIAVPNGTTTPNSSNEEDWIPITFTVDTLGNSEVTDDAVAANGVSF